MNSNEFNILKSSIERIESRLTQIETVLSVFKDDVCEIRDILGLTDENGNNDNKAD